MTIIPTTNEILNKLGGGIPLFVYGTLKRTFHNHRFLENETFISEGKTETPFLLYKHWGLPYVSNRDGWETHGHQIKGEVYSVRDINAIDRLEGAPHHYHAHQEIIDMGGMQLPCRIYLDSSKRHEMQLDDCIFTDEWTHEFSESIENDINYINIG